MATLRFYENMDGSFLEAVYDDVLMTCSGITVHVPATAATLTVNGSLGGTPITETYPPGTDTIFPLPGIPVEAVPNRNGTGVRFVGMDYIGAGE